MLLWFSHFLTQYFPAFRVFQYLSLRSIVSALTALVMVLFFCPMLIRVLRRLQIGQSVRNDGPQTHLQKSGTPTMGGILILIAITLSTLLWCDFKNPYIWIVLFTTLAHGVIGWVDDYRKVIKRNSKGLASRWKFFWQSVVSLTAIYALYHIASQPIETALIVPFFKDVVLQLGPCYIVLAYFVLVGTSNAVNLTDGLDGLVTMPIVLVAAALAIFAYLSGNHIAAHYLAIPYLPYNGELTIFCASIVGAGLGFLWYNTYPAEVFMGDVGSLSLGAALGIVAIMVRHEIVLFIMGGVFVAETLSVILQVASFKLTGKRIFKMAPLHHHFELKGWPEPRVIVRFWIITFILVLIGLATLKLR